MAPLDVNGLTDTKKESQKAVLDGVYKKKCQGCKRFFRVGYGNYHSEACYVRNERKGE